MNPITGRLRFVFRSSGYKDVHHIHHRQVKDVRLSIVFGRLHVDHCGVGQVA